MQEIQLFLNPGKGTAALSRITAVVGDRIGAMPKATRKGYVFTGWYLSLDGNPDSPEAIRITADTVLTEAMLGGDVDSAQLYARWEKPAAKSVTTKKTSLGTQKKAVVALLIVSLVLAVAFGAVSVIVDVYRYEDFDGVEYTIKKKKGNYGLYLDGVLCDINSDGYYQTDMGTQLAVDAATGEYEIYAVVDTEGTEVVGTGQRVLMFKQLTYDQSSTKDVIRSARISECWISSTIPISAYRTKRQESFSCSLITTVLCTIGSAIYIFTVRKEDISDCRRRIFMQVAMTARITTSCFTIISEARLLPCLARAARIT